MTPTRAFRIPNVLMERIDSARGAQSRTAFVVAALERELGPATYAGVPVVEDALLPEGAVVLVSPPETDRLAKPTVTVSPSEDAARLKGRLGLTAAGELARRVARPPDDFTKPPPIRRPLTSAEVKAGVKPL